MFGHVRSLQLLAVLSALATLALSASVAAERPWQTVTLTPGYHFLGWLGDATTPAQLSATLPPDVRLVSVDDSTHLPRTIENGSAIVLHAPDGPARPWLHVADGRYDGADMRLEPDETYRIIWRGQTGTSLTAALQGIGDALSSVHRWNPASQRFTLWGPDVPAFISDANPPPLRTGELLWLRVKRSTIWLRPGGDPAPIIGLAGADPQNHPDIEAAFDDLRRFYADRYGLEAHTARVFVGTDPKATIAEFEPRMWGGWSEGARTRWEDEGGIAGGWKDTLLIGRSDSSFPRWGSLASRLASSYGEALTYLLSDGASRDPVWLYDRHRYALADRFQGRNNQPGAEIYRRAALSDRPLQQFVSDWWQLSGDEASARNALSALAVYWLEVSFGEQQIFEYYRRIPAERSWQAAFERTFGLSIDQFYEQFERWREAGFPPLSGPSSDELPHHVIRGQVEGPDASPVARFQLDACPEDARDGPCVSVATNADGVYEFALPAGKYMLSAVLDARDCTVSRYYYGQWHDLTPDWSYWSLIDISDGDAPDRDIRLSALPGSAESAQWCEHGRSDYFGVHFVNMSGRLLDSDGQALGGIHLHACMDPGYIGLPAGQCYVGVSAANGDFHMSLPGDGAYQISVEPTWHRCQTFGWYADDGLLGGPERDQAQTFRPRGRDLIGLTLRLPDDPAALPTFDWCEEYRDD